MSTRTDDIEMTSPSNMDFNFYEDKNMQESIDTGYANVTRDSNSLSSGDDDDLFLPEVNRSHYLIDVSKQGDLDHDDGPTTQTLFLDFKIERSNKNQRNSFRSKTECQCQLKRSRSLADIELSLDEKGTQLRQEKVYVQRKVREAVKKIKYDVSRCVYFVLCRLATRKMCYLVHYKISNRGWSIRAYVGRRQC